jgi:hypothetical protein
VDIDAVAVELYELDPYQLGDEPRTWLPPVPEP